MMKGSVTMFTKAKVPSIGRGTNRLSVNPIHPGVVETDTEGLRGEETIAELCRKEGIAQNLYYR